MNMTVNQQMILAPMQVLSYDGLGKIYLKIYLFIISGISRTISNHIGLYN